MYPSGPSSQPKGLFKWLERRIIVQMLYPMRGVDGRDAMSVAEHRQSRERGLSFGSSAQAGLLWPNCRSSCLLCTQCASSRDRSGEITPDDSSQHPISTYGGLGERSLCTEYIRASSSKALNGLRSLLNSGIEQRIRALARVIGFLRASALRCKGSGPGATRWSVVRRSRSMGPEWLGLWVGGQGCGVQAPPICSLERKMQCMPLFLT